MRNFNSLAIVALVFVLVCPNLGVAQTREQQLFLLAHIARIANE